MLHLLETVIVRLRAGRVDLALSMARTTLARGNPNPNCGKYCHGWYGGQAAFFVVVLLRIIIVVAVVVSIRSSSSGSSSAIVLLY